MFASTWGASSLAEREIIFCPNVAIPNYTARQHHHNRPRKCVSARELFYFPRIQSRKGRGRSSLRHGMQSTHPILRLLGSCRGGRRRFRRKPVLRRSLASVAGPWIAAESWCVGYPLSHQTYFPLGRDSK